MTDPLVQLVIGTLATVISSMAIFIVASWRSQINDLKTDNKFWRDRSLAGDERVSKALDTLGEALILARDRNRARTGDRE